MSKIEKFEDMLAWQKAKELSVEVYKLTNKEALSKDFGLRDQIRKSAVSIASNIAEGYGRGGNKEFIQFLFISKGSLYELKTQLIIANEIGYLTINELENIKLLIESTTKLVTGLINYLTNSQLKGSKFKN